MSRDVRNLVFLDLETTGLDPHVHEILEVAFIVRNPEPSPTATDMLETTFHFALNINERHADERALEVNRYWERWKKPVNEGGFPAVQTDEWAAGVFLNHLRDAIIVGNNVQFDVRFIERFLLDCGCATITPWFYHPVDLKALVAGTFNLGEPPWSTREIAEAARVPIPADAHSALVDARWNRDVYDAVYSKRGTLRKLDEVGPGSNFRGHKTGRGYSLIGGISENFHPEDH